MLQIAKAVIYKNNKYLFQLRDNDASISYPNKWSFFGGELEEGENFEEALKRELVEELHWCPNKLIYLSKDTDKINNCNITYFVVHCELPDHKLILGEGQAMKWFSIQEIIDLDSLCRPNVVKQMIKQAYKHIKTLMRIVIVGHTGFIGNNIYQNLINNKEYEILGFPQIKLI